jgi:hypothetical protein
MIKWTYYINFVLVKSTLVLIFLLLSFSFKAQTFDTLRELFNNGYSIDARLESRNSFINNQLISVNGVRLGLSFQRKLRLGAGLSWLNSDVKSTFYQPNIFGRRDTLEQFLKFIYLAYYLDFVFYKTKRWQLSVPIQLGTGLSWFQNENTYNFSKNKRHFLLLYEPGITVQFKVFKWFGLGADVAYRFTMRNNKRTAEQLNSPTYSFKILFWFDQLFYDLFPKSPITERFGPSYW